MPPAARNPDPFALLGRRISVRHRLPDGRASDVVGVLEDAGERWRIRPEWAPPLEVPAAAVQAARAVPDPVVRPSSALPKLAWVMDHGWPGLERERLGAWVLRYGEGFTWRANSVLVLGEPGPDVPAAVDEVERRYRARGRPAAFQVDHPLPGSPRPEPAPELAAELDRRGYDTRVRVTVLVAGLLPEHSPRVHWADAPDQDWLALYEPPAGAAAGPATVRRVLAAGAGPRFAHLRDDDGTLLGGVRLVTAHRWAGISALTVHPGRRRQGHGRTLVAAALHRGRQQGARDAYVQVEDGNDAALALYRQAGFTAHHGFEFRVRPT